MFYFSGTPSLQCRTSQCEILGFSWLAQGDENEHVLGQELVLVLSVPRTEFLEVAAHSQQLLGVSLLSPCSHSKLTSHVEKKLSDSLLKHRTYGQARGHYIFVCLFFCDKKYDKSNLKEKKI